MNQLMDEKQAAALLNVSVKTLQARRSRGGGPRFAKLGRSVRYAVADLEAFVQAALRSSTSDPGAPPPKQSRIRVESLLEKTGRRLGHLDAAPALPPGKPR
jgi:predicted DNA-binding transcriptional regulator AlpA